MDEEAKVEIVTTVDMLIARMKTHPHEFFNAELLPKLDASDVLKGCKWGRLASHICNPTTTGLFSLDEKERFASALDKTMREALDVMIVSSLVTGEEFEKRPSVSEQQAYDAMGRGNRLITSQQIAERRLQDEMANEKLKWEVARDMQNSVGTIDAMKSLKKFGYFP